MSRKKPLDGVVVIDFTRVYSGPYCTMMLADLGAEVIKVERKEVGDDSRQFLPLPERTRESGYFMYLNRNKQSIELDLKDSRTRDLIYRISKKADIIVENYSPGVAKRLGIDYDTIRTHNPRIIYGSISGFGQTGPYSAKAAYDVIAQAMGGYMAISGPRGGLPYKLGTSIADAGAGIHMAYALIAALYHRDINWLETGQYIDVAMMDTVFSTLENFVVMQSYGGVTPRRNGNANLGSAPFNTFRTKDGHVAIAVANNDLFEKFTRAMERPDLFRNPTYCDNKGRKENEDTLNQLVETWTTTMTTQEVCEVLDKYKVPVGPILGIDELMDDPQIAAREMLVDMDHPKEGTVKMPGNPLKFSKTPVDTFAASPLLGEHTKTILEKYGGYSDAEIDQFIAQGVIG